MGSIFGWKVLLEIKESGITVVKRRNDRIMLSGNIIYSRLKDSTIYTNGYWDYFLPLAALHKRSNVLVLGLGGGTTPYQMNKLFDGRVSIEAVDIDKNTIRAMEAFLPKRPRVKITIGDAYEYVRNAPTKYDLIVLDIFKKLDVPKEFLSQSFIDYAYSALKPDGILAVNYVFENSGMRQFGFKKRLRRKFKMYTISEPRLFGNKIFVCSKRLGKEAILKLMNRNFPKSEENRHIFSGYEAM